MLLFLNEPVHTIKRNSPIIADDSSTAISIRKSCDYMIGTACPHLRCICIEDAFIVGFPVLRVEFHNLRIDCISILLGSLHSHPYAAIRLKRSLEWLVSLESDDFLPRLIKISRAMRGYGRYCFRIHIQNPALLTFLLAELHYLSPESLCIICRAFKKCLITIIRRVIPLDEVTDIDFLFPDARGE